jgi:hypothetical protein
MRHLLASAFLTALLASATFAQPVRIATWQLDDFAIAPTAEPTPALDEDRLRQVAAALKSVKPDIVVLYGLGDKQAARKLQDFLKQPHYHLTGPATLRRNGPGTPMAGQPVAIYSLKKAVASRTIEWRTSGRIDLPGGFTFATFDYGANGLSVFAAHWPENITGSGTNLPLNVFGSKRDWAAQYLLHHARWIAGTSPDQPMAVYVMGEWDDESVAASERTPAEVLKEAGLQMTFADGSRDRLVATFTNAPAMLGPVYVGGLNFEAPLELVPKKGFLDPLGLCKVGFNNSGFAQPGQSAQDDVRVRLGFDWRTLWWSVAAVTFALLGIVLLRTWREQRNTARRVVRRHAKDSVVVELSHGQRSSELAVGGDKESGFSSPVTETTTGQQTAWWEARSLASAPPNPVAVGARTPWMPHLSRLLREKLFVWLSSQRSQLLDSHETGTRQVLSLEERLERIQDQFQQRLIAQKERIAELEQEVQAKERLIRSLRQHEGSSEDLSE